MNLVCKTSEPPGQMANFYNTKSFYFSMYMVTKIHSLKHIQWYSSTHTVSSNKPHCSVLFQLPIECSEHRRLHIKILDCLLNYAYSSLQTHFYILNDSEVPFAVTMSIKKLKKKITKLTKILTKSKERLLLLQL